MKIIKNLFQGFKNKFANKWFLAGILIGLIFFILIVLYMLGYQPLAFVYSEF